LSYIGKGRRLAAAVSVALIAGAAGAATSVFAGATGHGGEAGSPVQAWGDDTYGEIGNGLRTAEPVRSPVAVEGLSCAVATAVTFHDSYAVLPDGHVDAWGADNAQGGLGDGDPGFQEYSGKPVEVPGISNAVQIAAEIPDTYVLLSDGTVDAWGSSVDGAFGLGPSGPISGDLPVTGVGHLSGVSQIATGDGAELALLSNGEVRSWGSNTNGQLGNDSEDGTEEPGTVGNEDDTDPLEHVKAVAEGVGYSLALMADGEVMAWGGSPTSGLGAGNLKTESELPVPVEDVAGDGEPLQHAIAIAAGASTAYTLLEGGTVVAWGYDALGQLGDGKAEVVTAFHPVAVASLKEVREIAATEGDGYARLANGTVWAWGNNTQGEVGNGSTTTPIPTPTQVTGLGSSTTRLADGPQGQPEPRSGRSPPNAGRGPVRLKPPPAPRPPPPAPPRRRPPPPRPRRARPLRSARAPRSPASPPGQLPPSSCWAAAAAS
jgi:alpha-tubulin suppressor-like RCC1 family protein